MRLVGTVELLAFIAVIMPRAWMVVAHARLGLGDFPDGSVAILMIRQASYTYGMHGVSLWVLASNVVRFRPLVILNGIAFLLGLPVFLIIDYTSGVPVWWTLMDGLNCGVFGMALLWLTRRDKAADLKSNL